MEAAMERKPSKQFIVALKTSGKREYKVAIQAGLHPSTLSQLINGAARVKPNDPRIISVGAILGLKPHECFESIEAMAS
jgi:DNA-binding transcriptional regulator YdaS (Cro superfamily)